MNKLIIILLCTCLFAGTQPSNLVSATTPKICKTTDDCDDIYHAADCTREICTGGECILTDVCAASGLTCCNDGDGVCYGGESGNCCPAIDNSCPADHYCDGTHKCRKR